MKRRTEGDVSDGKKRRPEAIGKTVAAWLDKNNKNDFDLIVSNRGFRGDPIDILMPAFHSGGPDNQGYTNPQVQTLLDAARLLNDMDQRRRAYRQVTQILADDLPYLWLYFEKEYKLVSTRVHGFIHVPDGMMRFRTVSLSPQ